MIKFTTAFETAALAAGLGLQLPRIGYQNLLFALLDSDVTASTSETTGPKDAPLRPDTAEYWQPTVLPATWEVDLGADTSIDYVGIAGANFGTSGVSCVVDTAPETLVGSPESKDWTRFAEEAVPTDDAPLLFLDSAKTARYVRITLTGGTDMPIMPAVYVGTALVIPREIGVRGYTPIRFSRKTQLYGSVSQGGQFLGQNIKRKGLDGNVQFELLDPDWYRANFEPFALAARRYPFFFAFWPGEYTDDVSYCWTDRDIKPSYMGMPNYMQVSINLKGIGQE